MSKVDTINYQGKDYATVPARLKEFRQSNPRADISTEPRFLEDGSVMFQATIVADRADENSARATGSALYRPNEISKPKAFEKLETISIGRALAVLGYLNNGEVATGEEMAEFEQFKSDRFATAIDKAESLTDLMVIFGEMSATEKKAFTEQLSAKKKELAHANA